MDLAGSERADATGAKGERLKVSSVNFSLQDIGKKKDLQTTFKTTE